ncbi:hypothetical protein SARC_11917 [Sphaeroforma arctica JP610]|uniref:Uncharacterized protein n=1 Tax=Sphaeroforma arctica JP610 TaxID=667725 RepID=A0A0L0FFM7_9EUKA|nr:hypothetical protein SARC_11917 [Sphaeroforma arctica JP610]KNC75559.1 hypothetical protein SARC_11917 [Sphaeroforma arctica JP610]|eukprot:XP_014149461.1 hypothetical protein SARC_11917 [Sphaeroforma arctica JP610]
MVNFGTMVIDGDCDTIKSCGKSNGDYSTGTTTAPGRTLDDGAVDNATLWITKKDRSRDKKSPPKADKQPAFLNRPLAFGDHKPKSAKKVPPPLTPQEQLKALGIVELKARQDALS